MLILIGNQKGGAGKSTLTLLLANYLAQQHDRRVTVLDMDHQQSLYAKAEKAKILENEQLYEIISADLSHFPAMQRLQERAPDEILLVDLPGKMDEDGLVPIFAAADSVICPFAFDEFSVDSTLLFAMVIGRINSRAPLVFVPNRIKNTVKYETRTEVEKVLRVFGTVAPVLPDRIDFQRVNSLHTPSILYPVILPLLDLIYDQYIAKQVSP